MPDETTTVKVREEITLNKYDGEAPIGNRAKNPAETITIVNQEVTRHVVRGTVVYDRAQGIDTRPSEDRSKPYRPYNESE